MKKKGNRNGSRTLNILAYDLDEAALRLKGLITRSKKLLSEIDQHIVKEIKICTSTNHNPPKYQKIKIQSVLGVEETKYKNVYDEYMKLMNDIKSNINKFEKKLNKIENLNLGELEKLFKELDKNHFILG